MDIRQSPSFVKSIKKIHPVYKKKINEIVPTLGDNIAAGDLMNGKTLGGIRHYKVDQNFSLYYVYCEEAYKRRNGRSCTWCDPVECSKITNKEKTIMLLYFGNHDISDNN